MVTGRPREFDEDEVLDRVVDLFWQHGYEGTSIAAITSATGLNKPSLYATFGGKEELFRHAFERYWLRLANFVGEPLNEPSVRVGIERLLHGLVDYQTQPDLPHGCLAVHGSLVGGDTSSPIRTDLNARRAATQAMVRKRLLRAKTDSEIANNVDVDDLASYIATLIQGLAVQAAGGASRDQLHRVIAVAMRAWP